MSEIDRMVNSLYLELPETIADNVKHIMIAYQTKAEKLVKTLRETAKTMILPNGDHICISTQLWLEELLLEWEED